jgi:FkbM family methyltransferase
LREELWWKLHKSPFVQKVYSNSFLKPVMRKASQILLPSGTEKALRVKGGIGKGLLLELNPRWEPHVWQGFFEPDAERIMEGYFGPGKTFYDIGGGIGFYSLAAARKGSQVCTFEPDPKNFKTIKHHAEINGLEKNVHLFSLAAYSHTGVLNMLPSNPGRGTGCAHAQAIFGGADADCFQAPCTTVDDFARKNPPPDLIKIDVEGAEVDVIRGADWLMKDLRTPILCEVHTAELAAEIEKIVLDRGYRVEWLQDDAHPVRWLYATAA